MPDDPFSAAMTKARIWLEPSSRPERAWPAVLAASFFAVCAMGFAVAAILAPPVSLSHAAAARNVSE
ncbi:hypothetical protein C5708_01145 [Caulobacter sp. CCUG 60055]|uniref:hypothetical protein n=1 Tax=Caulobacter sp. CCUG 60055 TaxID=2100090 RepID=UPI001FA6F042|nr:hypothetical protein [Caulobacter sp. CCUG 60055]MBQ1540610.1 hypothetical protein [Caulobacteraceae bacterium]MCI3178853.1 hypothetical protein [Caulobacter sp. CCUG 60055]